MWVFLAARARRAWQCEPQELYNKQKPAPGQAVRAYPRRSDFNAFA